jgi:hypothetical protein
MLVSGHPTDPNLNPRPYEKNFFFQSKKHASTGKRSSYPSTMTVMDTFDDIHLPVDKTSMVTARGSAVVSGPAVSKKKFQNKITFNSYLPTLIF